MIRKKTNKQIKQVHKYVTNIASKLGSKHSALFKSSKNLVVNSNLRGVSYACIKNDKPNIVKIPKSAKQICYVYLFYLYVTF